MVEIKGERNHEDDRNKHIEDHDILQIVNSIKGGSQKAEGSLGKAQEPCTIYQVSKVLCQVNEKCYEPQLVSIGPYHRNKKRLKPMEEKKFQYMIALLSRNPKLKLENFVNEIKKLEPKARKCYSESISLESKEFVEMMVFDGCFLIEIILRIHTTRINDELWLPLFMSHDILLLENQLPFFVLRTIISHVVPIIKVDSLNDLLLECFELICVLPLNEDAATNKSYHHVLDFFHHHCLPKPLESSSDPDRDSDLNVIIDADPHVQAQSNPDLDLNADPDPNALLRKAYADIEAQCNAKRGPDSESKSHAKTNADAPNTIERRSHADPNSNAQLSGLASSLEQVLIRRQRRKLAAKLEPPISYDTFSIVSAEVLEKVGIKFERKELFSILSAEELEEAGIKFERKASAGSFLDVEFDKKGTLKIPYLYFSDNLQTIFQNLIAYEQCYPKAGTFFTGYVSFMDNLIHTGKDVRILRHAGILEHGLGSNDELAKHVNELCRQIFFQPKTIHLSSERRAINDYCRTKRHTWRAKLMHSYFNSPWSILSFLGAVLLLLLAIIQTVFEILPNG